MQERLRVFLAREFPNGYRSLGYKVSDIHAPNTRRGKHKWNPIVVPELSRVWTNKCGVREARIATRNANKVWHVVE